MTKSEITKNTTNEQLELLFANELASGIPFCFYKHLAVDTEGKPKKDKEGKEYYSIFIVQKKENPNAVASLDAMLLGWKNERVYRSVKRISKEVFENKALPFGKLAEIGVLHLDKSGKQFTTIEVKHTLVKPYEGKEPRKVQVDKEWHLVCDVNGNLTYEETNLVLFGQEKDELMADIKLVKESEYQMNAEPELI